METLDIFATGFRLPGRVCILAPGPNGRGHHGEIPADHLVIAVSKAVLIEEVAAKPIWLMNHGDQDWFPMANAAFRGMRVFSADALLAGRQRLEADGVDICYYYQAPPDILEPDTVDRADGAIRYGTTVSGCALQFAYNFGAREVLLCGVDMSGDGYWDGTVNRSGYHGEVWPAAETLSRFARWLREERGVEVATLSETRIDVPFYRAEGA